MTESVRDRWLSIGMSVLLHGSLVALLAIGWWHFRSSTPAPSVPINATVVDARTLKGVGAASTPTPKQKPAPQAQPQQQPPPPLEGPPPPTPDELAMRQQAAQQEAQHEAEAQKQLLARQQAEQAREEQEKAQAAAAQQAADQAAEAKKAAEAEVAAHARKLAQTKKLAEAKKKAAAAKLAAQKKLAEERKLAAEKKLAEQQSEAERAARVADLQQSLREEEQASAASGALASWQTELESRIQQHWNRPPTAQAGIDCVLNVSLVSGGDVTDVTLGQCNGDDAVRESIKNAVYAASPLPPPPNNIAFPHQLVIEFKPTT